MTVNLVFIQKLSRTVNLFSWSYGSFRTISFFFLLPACSFFLFSLWISGFVFLCSLFIYILSHLSPCLLSVSLVKSKLDPESLGIILLGPFLLEFFPDQVGVCVCQRWTIPLYDKCLPPVTKPHLKYMDKLLVHTHITVWVTLTSIT